MAAPKPAQRQDLFKKASEALLELQQKSRALEAETAERRRGLETRIAELSSERQILERSNASLSRRVSEREKEIETQKEKIGKDGTEATRLAEESARVLDESRKFLVRLEKHVQDGIPWMQEQRKAAVARARAAMSEPDITPSSALALVNHLQEEEESLGRTIESGRVRIDVGGEPRSVPAIRIGLIAVAYASEDGTVIGYAHSGQSVEQGKVESGTAAAGESGDGALQKVSSGYSAALAVLQRKLTPRVVDFFIPGLPVIAEEHR